MPEQNQALPNQVAFTVDQAAAALTIGRTKLLELIHGGALKCARIGRRIVIPRTALESFLESQIEEGA